MSFLAQESVPLGKAAPQKFHDGNGGPPIATRNRGGARACGRPRIPYSSSSAHRSYRTWPYGKRSGLPAIRVTGPGLCSIMCDASLRINRAQLEVLTSWTFPYIEMLVVLEPRSVVLTRSLVRVPPQHFKANRHRYQKHCVPRRQQHFDVNAAHCDPRGLTTSAKSISSG